MLKQILVLVIFFSLFHCTNGMAQKILLLEKTTSEFRDTTFPKQISNKQLEILTRKNTIPEVLSAIYFVKPELLGKGNLKTIDSLSKCELNTYFKKNGDTFIFIIDSKLNNFSTPDSLFDKLTVWCDNEKILNSLLNSEYCKNVYFEQVAYNLVVLRPVFAKYLKPKQSWGSLEFTSSCNLYYDVLGFVYKLPIDKRLDFLKSFNDEVYKLLASDSTIVK